MTDMISNSDKEGENDYTSNSGSQTALEYVDTPALPDAEPVADETPVAQPPTLLAQIDDVIAIWARGEHCSPERVKDLLRQARAQIAAAE